MHWIIQNNLFSDDGLAALASFLRQRDVPLTLVSVLPSGDLSPTLQLQGPVIVFGSVGLVDAATERGWQPGVFLNANHSYLAWLTNWGRLMLNADGRVTPFREVEPVGRQVFMRPAKDRKFFTGGLFDADDVRSWRDAVIRGERPPVRCSPRMDGDTLVVCGPPVHIHRESRFFVVDGSLVAWSTYKVDRRSVATLDVDAVSRAFAAACLRLWQPDRAFVLDVALTEDGPRIVEVNCINSAGFYGADVERIGAAIEAMEPWANTFRAGGMGGAAWTG